VTRQEVVDKIADNRVGFIAQLRHNPANQRAAPRVPFQVDRAVCSFAVDLGPTVRAARPLMFSGNQIKSPKLRIGHDLFP